MFVLYNWISWPLPYLPWNPSLCIRPAVAALNLAPSCPMALVNVAFHGSYLVAENHRCSRGVAVLEKYLPGHCSDWVSLCTLLEVSQLRKTLRKFLFFLSIAFSFSDSPLRPVSTSKGFWIYSPKATRNPSVPFGGLVPYWTTPYWTMLFNHLNDIFLWRTSPGLLNDNCFSPTFSSRRCSLPSALHLDYFAC